MSTQVVSAMTKAEARAAMDFVVSALEEGLNAFDRARLTVASIEERHGYEALGHRSMAACLAVELKVTRQRAYQVLNEIRGTALLTEAVGSEVVPTRRQAREIAAHPEVVARVIERVEAGAAPSPALQAALAEQRNLVAERGGAAPKPQGKHKGYRPLVDVWRGWCASLESTAEEMADQPLDIEAAKVLRRLNDVVVGMLRA